MADEHRCTVVDCQQVIKSKFHTCYAHRGELGPDDHVCPVESCTRIIGSSFKACFEHKNTILLGICDGCKKSFTAPIWKTTCGGCYGKRLGPSLADLKDMF